MSHKMFHILVFGALLASVLSKSSEFECGVQSQFKGLISGGEIVKKGEFPWIVAIKKMINGKPQYICTGTIITSKKVITAAHCVQEKGHRGVTAAKDLSLFFGTFDLNNEAEDGRIMRVPEKVIVHPAWNYSIERYNDDIAILVLGSEIPFSDNIRPICVTAEKIQNNDGVVVAWGKSEDETKTYENIPRKLKVQSMVNEDCFLKLSELAKIAWKKSFCAGNPNQTAGVCLGDSGGGFFVKLNHKFYFKGFVSSGVTVSGTADYGTNCYTVNNAVYTDVTEYLDFMGLQTAKQTCGVMSSDSSLIIGGEVSKRNQFPWVVSISRKENANSPHQHQGTGTLISDKHVVSRASSVASAKSFQAYPAENFELFLGSSKYDGSSNERGAIKAAALNILIHPSAKNGKPSEFNVALITLKEPVAYSDFIQPACLQSSKTDNFVGHAAYAVGFGWDIDRKLTEVKKHVMMTIDNSERCSSVWGSILKQDGIKSKFFCASGRYENHGPYAYDSSLYMKQEGKWFLKGMVGMLKLNKPVVFENISVYADWIIEKTLASI